MRILFFSEKKHDDIMISPSHVCAVEVTENVTVQHSRDLNLNIGDMVGATYFNKTEPYIFGVLLDDEYKHKWWEFEEIPYEEAIRRPFGRFPSNVVRVP